MSLDFLPNFIAILAVLSALIYIYFKSVYKYWEKRNIFYIQPKFPLGNNKRLFVKSIAIGADSKEFYDEVKKNGQKMGGIFTIVRPVLVLTDPDLIRDVMSIDFQYFTSRGFYYNEKDDPISAHLFAIDGAKWKNMRVKLTPTFTSGKMKVMHQLVMECSEYMIEALEKLALNRDDIDIREMLASFTTDVIGSCAFGINCNSFKHPDAEFRTMGKKIFLPTNWSKLKSVLIYNLPKLALRLGVKRNEDEISNFFFNVVKQTVKSREDGNIIRPDFLQLLIDLKHKPDGGFTMEQLVAQVFIFFIAGFDTSSTTMNFALYELAQNLDIQEKVREEIKEVLKNHNSKITYESLGEMKYLKQVIDETLRLYPPVPCLHRTCVQDYKFKDNDLLLEKGTPVLISTLGIHRDPEFYPDPLQFDPERFSAENKQGRHPYVYLPFGEGPRNCIGLRFGMMQSKIGIISILRKFRLTISPNTKMPLTIEDGLFLLKSWETLYLKAEKL